MNNVVWKVKETLDGYVPSNVFKTIQPGVKYYVGMPLIRGADGMMEPTENDPEYICMADYKEDDDVVRLDVPCMKVGPQIIFEKIDGNDSTITQISGGGVQSDLSVNDESDPAFVKGRTHYETDRLTITGEYNSTYSYSMEVPVLPGFNEGDTVTVIWDGTEYEVTAKKTSYGVYVGNYSFIEYRGMDTGHPFLWYYGNKSDGTVFSTVYAGDNKTHTIQIKDKIFSVSLDKKFLPLDTIFKKDLDDSMKPLSVKVSLGSISSGTISNITLDKTFDEIKKAYDENREIRFYKNNNQSSYSYYETFTPDYIISNTNEFMGFYLRRVEYSGGNIYFYNVKIHNGFTYSGSMYTLSKA